MGLIVPLFLYLSLDLESFVISQFQKFKPLGRPASGSLSARSWIMDS